MTASRLFKFSLLVSVLGAFCFCKSRYEFTGKEKKGASNPSDDSTGVPFEPAPNTDTPANTTGGGVSGDTGGDTTSGGTTAGDTTGGTQSTGTPSTGTSAGGSTGATTGTQSGGPFLDIEVLQNSVVVTKITAGIPVVIRPTETTRDLDNGPGCSNPGILNAKWYTGSRLISTIQRATNTDCKGLSTSGTFTQGGNVVITLEVLTDEGEAGSASKTYEVVVASSTSTTGTGPTQK